MTTVFYIPDGTSNLSRLFPINWNEVESYKVEAQDHDGYTVATTPLLFLHSCNCLRIHFVNYAGCIDAVNFRIVEKVHEEKSGQFQKPLSYPLIKQEHSIGRINIEANDSYTVSAIDYAEKNLLWLDELADTPLAWMEWTGTQGQANDYLPIVISDTKKVNLKEENRYTYELTLQFIMSNARIPLRT